MTVYFASKKRLADRWRLFFHLDGPGGFRNLDHVPVDGLLPVDRWRPGQRIRDVQQIFIPPTTPPGTYTFSVGAFRGVERLKVTPARLTDGKKRLKVGTFVVSRARARLESEPGHACMLVCPARGNGTRTVRAAPRLEASRARLPLPLLAAGAVVALAIVEALVALTAPLRAPKADDWAAVERDVRAGFRPGDLIVAAPAWADPIMRMHLGDLISIPTAGRMDGARFSRVWEIDQRGARAPETRDGRVVLERHHGALTRAPGRTRRRQRQLRLPRALDRRAREPRRRERRRPPLPLARRSLPVPADRLQLRAPPAGRGRHPPALGAARAAGRARARGHRVPGGRARPRDRDRDRPVQRLDAQGGQGPRRAESCRSTASRRCT